ncbi:MAG TPA: thioredoxin domain-containing protein, partial [Candidatus Omnitrophota bacterium]|nr:thioredoxin domain-containing protein [Candidatus Omnitrophota bacterium]
LMEILQEQTQKTALETITVETLQKAFDQFNNYFDEKHGGFGSEPKFPSSHNLSFLLRWWRRTSDPRAIEMVNKTLTEMYRGGMYDQLGGGFHRYSTDQYWQVPHFEKMLYDQAILSRTYLEAYQATGDSIYAKAAREIFDYVLRDLRDPQGGFFSAEDADSLDVEEPSQEKKEGAFYLWKFDEIIQLFGPEDSKIFNYRFGVEANGNAKLDPQGEFIGKNILYAAHSIEDTAQHFNVSVEEINKIIERCRPKLLQTRGKRPHPHLDDKILVDWNGLMISSLAFGGCVLSDQRYIQAAEESIQFILRQLKTKDGKLLHRFRDGEAGISATLMDYAFLIHGLLDLYEATFNVEYLKEALSLAQKMVRFFGDEKEGGFFFAAHNSPDVILPQKDIYDGAMPSGNSIAALDLVRLFHFTLDKQWEEHVQKLFRVFSNDLTRHPSAYAQMLIALDFFLGPSQEVILAGQLKDPLLNQMIQSLFSKFIPNKVVIVRPADQRQAQEIISLIPSLERQIPLEGKTTAYVCQNHVCQLPIGDLQKFEGLTNPVH